MARVLCGTVAQREAKTRGSLTPYSSPTDAADRPNNGDHPASATRPASVIRTRTTSIGRLPACTVSGVAVANPSCTRSTADRLPDAARRSSPWRGTSAAQPRRLLPPVRPGIGTDDSAAGAHHAWAERWHWHVIGPRVRAQDRPVVALPAAHVERPHAVGAHVAQRHRLAFTSLIRLRSCGPDDIAHSSIMA
jgi:hypothetical protein